MRSSPGPGVVGGLGLGRPELTLCVCVLGFGMARAHCPCCDSVPARGAGGEPDEPAPADRLHRERGPADLLRHLRGRGQAAPVQDSHHPQGSEGELWLQGCSRGGCILLAVSASCPRPSAVLLLLVMRESGHKHTSLLEDKKRNEPLSAAYHMFAIYRST